MTPKELKEIKELLDSHAKATEKRVTEIVDEKLKKEFATLAKKAEKLEITPPVPQPQPSAGTPTATQAKKVEFIVKVGDRFWKFDLLLT